MSSTLIAAATSALPPPAATTTSSGDGQSKSGPTSSPLLFFVALGFGVVFTNLWIIVGVKYCFRYNRVRNARLNGQDVDVIDLQPVRPHRRRREKKLMTMEEVNERFPLTKYKQWKSTRETQGLPSSGGIQSTPPSRAASLKDVEGTVSPGTGTDTDSADKRADTVLALARDDDTAATSASKEQETAVEAESKKTRQSITVEEKMDDKDLVRVRTTEHYQPGKDTTADEQDDSDDEDDPIRTAAAPELLAEPGDTCAICLDTLEHDDDVRGLTCGHAFHASCLDPWLTSRRACCPLCKADYFTPKPTAEGETTDPAIPGRRGTGGRNPSVPQATHARGNVLLRSRMVFFPPSRPPGTVRPRANPRAPGESRWAFPWSREVRQQRQQQPRRATSIGRSPADPRPATYEPAAPQASWRSRLAVPNPFARARTTDAASGDTPQPTPGQLEAGNR